MSDIAIQLLSVGKSFRRFQHPAWRVLDALGWPVPQKHYDIFTALRDITFDVHRGERVALIGRNGAGKSTLLRVISSQMYPEAGEVIVKGTVQALMELGTGFHPDFTGIENIRSALAYQGVSPQKLYSTIEEIIEFAELDTFINRPVREYSSGMYARLAFAVATTISPEILIIDEILGTGDAYFVGKCIQRMKVLTSNGCTILFVSHDLSSVQLLCDRGIWIDRGRIREDGDLLSVSKSYLASVREDEEFRVRSRSMQLSRSQVEFLSLQQGQTVLLHLIGILGSPPDLPLAIAEIRFGIGELHLGTLAPKGNDGDGRLIRDSGLMNWRGPENIHGRSCWLFGNFGGRYGHAPFQIGLHSSANDKAWVEIDYHCDFSAPVALERFDHNEKTYIRLCEFLRNGKEGWLSVRAEWPISHFVSVPEPKPEPKEDQRTITEDERYGTNEVRITMFAFQDQSCMRRHTLITGEPAEALINFEAERAVCDPVAVIAIYRTDGSCAMQLISKRNGISIGEVFGAGRLRVKFEPLLLGPGDYLVSVAFFHELNLSSRLEPQAYDLHDRCYALKVLPPPGVGVEIGIVNQPVIWERLQ